MPSVVKVLANAIRGEFEALEFAKSNKKDHKICYVRLSEKLDAMQVIETIMSKTKYSAYLPNNVPNLAPASKKGKIPLKTRLRLRIPQSQTPDKVMVETHAEILTELQCKYTGLFNLSKKTGHKLLESIAQTVFERLKEISDTNPEVMETGFMLSKMYRKLHPHFGDFQLILSTLHKLQDAAGVPRLQLAEAELMSASAHPFSIDNVSMDKILIVSNKYTEKIVKKITEHVDSFNLEVADGDSEEEVARKKVREHLKKMSPYYSEIVKQVISNHFIPPKSPFHRVRKTDAGETEELETSGEEEEGDYEIDEEGFHVVADDKEEVKPNTEANAAKLEPVANCSTAEAVVEETGKLSPIYEENYIDDDDQSIDEEQMPMPMTVEEEQYFQGLEMNEMLMEEFKNLPSTGKRRLRYWLKRVPPEEAIVRCRLGYKVCPKFPKKRPYLPPDKRPKRKPSRNTPRKMKQNVWWNKK